MYQWWGAGRRSRPAPQSADYSFESPFRDQYAMSQVAAPLGYTSLTGAGTAPRILVVDDEPYMCDVCTRTLQRGGYQVTATSDPRAAERMLRDDQHFDLLLTDIKMPSMN